MKRRPWQMSEKTSIDSNACSDRHLQPILFCLLNCSKAESVSSFSWQLKIIKYPWSVYWFLLHVFYDQNSFVLSYNKFFKWESEISKPTKTTTNPTTPATKSQITAATKSPTKLCLFQPCRIYHSKTIPIHNHQKKHSNNSPSSKIDPSGNEAKKH